MLELLQKILGILHKPITVIIEDRNMVSRGEVVGVRSILLGGMLLMNNSVMGITSARFRSVHSVLYFMPNIRYSHEN